MGKNRISVDLVIDHDQDGFGYIPLTDVRPEDFGAVAKTAKSILRDSFRAVAFNEQPDGLLDVFILTKPSTESK